MLTQLRFFCLLESAAAPTPRCLYDGHHTVEMQKNQQ